MPVYHETNGYNETVQEKGERGKEVAQESYFCESIQGKDSS